MRNLFFIPILLIVISCSEPIKVPEQYLQREQMAAVMTDLLMAQATLDQISMPRDSAKIVFQEKFKLPILKKKGIDLAQFDSSFVFYSNNAELMFEVWEMIEVEVAKRKESDIIFSH